MTFDLSNSTFFKENVGMNVRFGKQAKGGVAKFNIEWDSKIKLLLNTLCLFD